MHYTPAIVVDIDEILADTLHKLIAHDNKKLKCNHKWEEFNTYKLWKVWNCTREESVVRVNDFFESENFSKITPVEGSQKGIEQLSRKCKLHLVTGRTDQQDIQTKEFINKYFPNKFASIEFTSHYYKETPTKKSEVCKKLNAKIIIEDDLEHAIDCANQGIKVILLNRPWNQHPNHENIIRVNSWDEIVKKVNEINYVE
jgi:uncharacterized HAD superfamily protein